jgi:N-acyl-D-amino-acid deacylase
MEAVDAARRDGVDVTFDMHTRLHGLTYLMVALPSTWLELDKHALAARLREPATRSALDAHQSILHLPGDSDSSGPDWQKVVLFDNAIFPEYARRSVADIAAERRQSPAEAICDLLLGSIHDLHQLMVLLNCYSEELQRASFQHDLCMPGSDATALAPDGPLAKSSFHGAYTWAAWFYRYFVRELELFTPAEAIHKLTGLPAQVLGLTDRGVLRAGGAADIAVFDGDLFEERGTTYDPNQLATGMRHVIVNGNLTLRDGELTGTRGGAIIKK